MDIDKFEDDYLRRIHNIQDKWGTEKTTMFPVNQLGNPPQFSIPVFGKKKGTTMVNGLTNDDAHRLLALRMRWVGGMVSPYAHLSLYLGSEKAMVFIVPLKNEKPTILEDDIDLFPSDALVTSLRLLVAG